MVITISREYGSGGAEIAHKLAEKLNIPCYDKSMAKLTSDISGFPTESVEEAEDKVSGVFEYMSGSYTAENLPVYDRIYLAQREMILMLARMGNCVIVGRCAANILQEAELPTFDVFIYAPMEERIKRIKNRQNLDERRAERVIRKKDEYRKNYYRRYAYADWGNKSNYDLLINSTIGCDKAVSVIAEAVKGKMR